MQTDVFTDDMFENDEIVKSSKIFHEFFLFCFLY